MGGWWTTLRVRQVASGWEAGGRHFELDRWQVDGRLVDDATAGKRSPMKRGRATKVTNVQPTTAMTRQRRCGVTTMISQATTM